MTRIPSKNEIVTFNNQPHKVLSMNLGGKVTLKLMVGKSRKVVKDVDVSKLKEHE